MIHIITIILEGIFNSCFTFSIPTWAVVVAVVLTCWLLYWDKSLSKLRIKGKPRCIDATHSSFTISWDRPTFAVPEYYIVYFKRAFGRERWESTRTLDGACTITVTDLKPNTKYRARVCACVGTEVGPTGEESDEIITRTLAFKIKQRSTLCQEGTPTVFSKYAVQWTPENDESLKIQKIFIGDTNVYQRQEGKIILLISTQHSGKTTLIEGILNYVLGVRFDDDFRFCLSPDISDQDYRGWIKIYRFDEYEGGRITFPLSIIDIPRLESSNKERNEMIRELIKSLSNSVWERINCLCLVSKGSDFELSTEQIKYIKSILHFFPDHLMSNLCAFYNFADAGDPIIETCFQHHEIAPISSFPVNWSALFHNDNEYSPLLWRINHKRLRLFFDFVTTTSPEAIRENVQLPTPTKREELKSAIANTQPEVSNDLAKLEEMKTRVDIFTKDRDKIISSGDTSFTIEEIRQIKHDLERDKHVTNCMQCFFTCHKDCGIPDDGRKIGCVAMSNGYCTVCTGHCIWSAHKNTPYIYEYVSEKVTKSYKEMKAKYEQEKGETLTYDEYLGHLNRDIEVFLQRLHAKVQRITECKNELQGISMSPLANSVGDTIEDMIISESLKREPGYEKRIQMYQELQKYSKMIRVTRN